MKLANDWRDHTNNADLWRRVTWFGRQTCQWPTDLVIYNELICRQRPSAVVETGTAAGGSALFFATCLELIGGGVVISVDRKRKNIPKHSIVDFQRTEIHYVTGDSKAPQTVAKVSDLLDGSTNVLVYLDSDHHAAHVLAELRAYSQFVPVNGYLVVADTCVENLKEWHGDNPAVAVRKFLDHDKRFKVDRSCEKLVVTYNPGGFLRRVEK